MPAQTFARVGEAAKAVACVVRGASVDPRAP